MYHSKPLYTLFFPNLWTYTILYLYIYILLSIFTCVILDSWLLDTEYTTYTMVLWFFKKSIADSNNFFTKFT